MDSSTASSSVTLSAACAEMLLVMVADAGHPFVATAASGLTDRQLTLLRLALDRVATGRAAAAAATVSAAAPKAGASSSAAAANAAPSGRRAWAYETEDEEELVAAAQVFEAAMAGQGEPTASDEEELIPAAGDGGVDEGEESEAATAEGLPAPSEAGLSELL